MRLLFDAGDGGRALFGGYATPGTAGRRRMRLLFDAGDGGRALFGGYATPETTERRRMRPTPTLLAIVGRAAILKRAY